VSVKHRDAVRLFCRFSRQVHSASDKTLPFCASPSLTDRNRHGVGLAGTFVIWSRGLRQCILRTLPTVSEIKRFAWVVVFVTLCSAGCGQPDRLHRLRGFVVDKNAARSELTLQHDQVPGLMPAMTMPFPVKDAAGFVAVQRGDVISADLVVARSATWLQDLNIIDSRGRQEQVGNAAVHMARLGDPVPDVSFTNEANNVVRFSQFQGRALLLSFIYTRCPLPNFCPLLSSRFAAIQSALVKRPDAYARTHLFSVSLDPEYDTPPVLEQYGLRYVHDRARFEHWDFVSAAPQDLQKLVRSLGVYDEQDGAEIAHSLNVVLIGRDGTIKKTWVNADWRVDDVVAALVAESLGSGSS
jgi:protein SCO1/2